MTETPHHDASEQRSIEEQKAREYARWAAAPLFSFGFLAPLPFVIAAKRTGERSYLTAAAVWTAMVVACFVSLAIDGAREGATFTAIGGLIIFINMGGATLHTLGIRRDVGRRLALEEAPELTGAQRRVDLRARARAIATSDPSRALELGVGRPDLAGSFDGGLVDVNHAPAEVLTTLPGIDDAQARRIVELRMNGNGFVSAEDLDMVLDLDPGTVAEIAARTVFLPRF